MRRRERHVWNLGNSQAKTIDPQLDRHTDGRAFRRSSSQSLRGGENREVTAAAPSP